MPVEGGAWTVPVVMFIGVVLFMNGPAPAANTQHGLPVSQPCVGVGMGMAGCGTGFECNIEG